MLALAIKVAVYRGNSGTDTEFLKYKKFGVCPRITCKDFGVFADSIIMSRVLQQQGTDYSKQRSAFRISMIADEPVYLLLSMEGKDIDPIVDELGGGGARLVSPKYYDFFYVGQMIGPAVLVLQDEGMPVIYPVVKWKTWPIIGVEFMEISEKDREMIMRFLFRVERRMVQQDQKAALRRRPQ
jgi:hypothetical protein